MNNDNEIVELNDKSLLLAFTICFHCKHYDSDYSCSAFPNGIPDDICSGEIIHTTPYKNDNGIVFEEESFNDLQDFIDENHSNDKR